MYIIIGAGGFLGYSLAESIARSSLPLTTISRGFQWSPFDVENRICVQIDDYSDWSSIISSSSSVIYMAGASNLADCETSPEVDLAIHINQMDSFFQGIKTKVIPKKLMFISSAGTVYGDSMGQRKTENSSLSPKSAYGLRNVKLEQHFQTACYEIECESFDILRVTNPYAPCSIVSGEKV